VSTERSCGGSPDQGVVGFIGCWVTSDNRWLCELAALPGRRRKQGMDAPIGPAGHSRGRSRSAVSSPDGMAARRRCDRRTHPLTAVAATDPADVGPVPHRRRLGHAARPRSCRDRDSVRRSAPGRARPARRAAPRLRFPEPSVPAGGADGPDPPVGCPTWSPRRSGVGAAQGARDRRAHLDQLGGRRPRRVPLAADGGPERRRRRSGCTVAGDGGDVGEAGDACGHQAVGVAGVTPTGPYFPAPRPRLCRHRAARTRVPRMRGAFCRDLLPRALRKKRWDPSAGGQRRRRLFV